VRYGKARAELLPPEGEKSAVPRVVQFCRNMDQFEVIAKKCPEWILVAKIALKWSVAALQTRGRSLL
jgi:hypothetical protein